MIVVRSLGKLFGFLFVVSDLVIVIGVLSLLILGECLILFVSG